MSDGVRLHESWRQPLIGQFQSSHMQALKAFLLEEKARGKRIFPKDGEYFLALDLTPLEAVRVVILGQDPYHGPAQAPGLSFSVPPGLREIGRAWCRDSECQYVEI